MSSILEEYEQLCQQKDEIEAEISAIADELTTGPNAPGLKGQLVDAEGFPRADIDVYRVRHQRHAFACKQTDHREIMQRIEKILPQYAQDLISYTVANQNDVECLKPRRHPYQLCNL